MTLEALLDKLERVRKSGAGFMARCPAHEDRKPSLRIKADGDKILVFCQAGCTTDDVLARLGLTTADLFINGLPQRREVASYRYLDEAGDLLYEVVRYDPKDFSVRRPDGQGGWIRNIEGVRRVLYCLPGLPAAEQVIIPEGEKDVETAWALGFPATCNVFGAGRWRSEYSEVLRGKHVIINPDADDAGRKHAFTIATSLYQVARSLKMLELPGAKDLTEWKERGGTAEALKLLIDAAPIWTPQDEELPSLKKDAPAAAWPEPMAREAFTGQAGDFVRLVGPDTEADLAALLMNFLVASGVLFGREAFCIADGRKHYPVEYALLVGKTGGGRKGTATTRTLAVMNRVEEDFSETHVVGGLSSGEGLIRGLSPKTGKWSEPHSFLGFLGEFGSLLSVMRREGNTISTVLREAWDCERLRVMTRRQPLDVSNVNLSIMAHITPDELLNNLMQTDRVNGFANRFLVACVRRSQFLPEGGQGVNLNEIVQRLRQAVVAAKGRGLVKRDAAARDLWAEVYPLLTEGRDGLAGALSSRAEAHTLRLSLLYALLDGAEEIRIDHLRAALAVWDYCERSINYIFGGQSGDPEADRILRAVADGPQTVTDLLRAFGNNRSTEWLKAKLATMVRAEKLVETTKEGAQKTVPAWAAK